MRTVRWYLDNPRWVERAALPPRAARPGRRGGRISFGPADPADPFSPQGFPPRRRVSCRFRLPGPAEVVILGGATGRPRRDRIRAADVDVHGGRTRLGLRCEATRPFPRTSHEPAPRGNGRTGVDARPSSPAAGPPGLTAAYELTKHGRSCVVLEADPEMVGGISRTDVYKGYRFDIGGHRFFSKSDEVNALWREVLGDQLITRSRMSRIYYDRKFFHYPLRPFDALVKLGPVRAAAILASYVKARACPIRPERSFEDWVVNRFGRVLFGIFFKTYTEKVWGMPTNDDLRRLGRPADQGAGPDPGRHQRPLRRPVEVEGRGHQDPDRQLPVPPARPRPDVGDDPRPRPRARRRRSSTTAGSSASSTTARPSPRWSRPTPTGAEHAYRGRHYLSTLPVRALVRSLDPPPPAEVLAAADALKYRDFLTVVLIVDQPETFPDNWIYIHEPAVRVGRVQNFKNWSPDDGPRPVAEQPRPGILLLRGGRPLDDVRRRPDRAGPPRDRRDRPGRRRQGDRRLRRPDAQGVPGLRRRRTRTTSP